MIIERTNVEMGNMTAADGKHDLQDAGGNMTVIVHRTLRWET